MVAVERALGWSRQLRVTPLSAGAYIAIKMLTSLVLGLASTAVVYLAGVVVGKPSMPACLWVATGVCVWIGSLLFGAFGLFVGYLLPSENVMQIIGFAMMLFSFGGGLFIPLSQFSPALRTAAEFTPSTGSTSSSTTRSQAAASTGPGRPTWSSGWRSSSPAPPGASRGTPRGCERRPSPPAGSVLVHDAVHVAQAQGWLVPLPPSCRSALPQAPSPSISAFPARSATSCDPVAAGSAISSGRPRFRLALTARSSRARATKLKRDAPGLRVATPEVLGRRRQPGGRHARDSKAVVRVEQLLVLRSQGSGASTATPVGVSWLARRAREHTIEAAGHLARAPLPSRTRAGQLRPSRCGVRAR